MVMMIMIIELGGGMMMLMMMMMTIEKGGGMMMQPPSPRNPDLLHSTLPYYSDSQVSSLSIITIPIKGNKGQSCPCFGYYNLYIRDLFATDYDC